MTTITLEAVGINDKTAMDSLRSVVVNMLADLSIADRLRVGYSVGQKYGNASAEIVRGETPEEGSEG